MNAADIPCTLSLSMLIFFAYIHDGWASSIPHWFVVIYVKDYTLVLKQAATIPPARDTAQDANTI